MDPGQKRVILTTYSTTRIDIEELFRFLNPSFFGSKGHFSRKYGKPIQEDKKLSSLVVRAEGGRIVVRQQHYKKLRKALEGYGVLKG